MAFTAFKTLAEVVKIYRLHFTKADFQFRLTQSAGDVSETAIGENLIYPVLKAAWKPPPCLPLVKGGNS